MKYLLPILGLFFGAVLLIKTSIFWVPWLWESPSRARALGPHRFPPHLELELPTIVSENKFTQRLYVYTDAQGALIHPHQLPTETLLVGGKRTSSLYTEPGKRWASRVSLPNLNFSFPTIYLDEIPDLVKNLTESLSTPVKNIFFVHDMGIRKSEPRTNPWDVQSFRLWNEAITSHPLYEFLFLETFKWLGFPRKNRINPANLPRSSQEAKDGTVLKRKDVLRYEEMLLQLKSILNRKSISFNLVILPQEPRADRTRSHLAAAFVSDLPAKGISIINLQHCFEQSDNTSSFFLGSHDFSASGHVAIAQCFDHFLADKENN